MNLIGTALGVPALAGCASPNRLKPGLQTTGGSCVELLGRQSTRLTSPAPLAITPRQRFLMTALGHEFIGTTLPSAAAVVPRLPDLGAGLCPARFPARTAGRSDLIQINPTKSDLWQHHSPPRPAIPTRCRSRGDEAPFLPNEPKFQARATFCCQATSDGVSGGAGGQTNPFASWTATLFSCLPEHYLQISCNNRRQMLENKDEAPASAKSRRDAGGNSSLSDMQRCTELPLRETALRGGVSAKRRTLFWGCSDGGALPRRRYAPALCSSAANLRFSNENAKP